MLIALLAVLGVDLIVIVVVAAGVLSRKAPFLFRNELVVINRMDEERVGAAGEVKRARMAGTWLVECFVVSALRIRPETVTV